MSENVPGTVFDVELEKGVSSDAAGSSLSSASAEPSHLDLFRKYPRASVTVDLCCCLKEKSRNALPTTNVFSELHLLVLDMKLVLDI